MQAKLTLRLESELIRRAKTHTRRAGTSVSQLVAEFFALLGNREERERANLGPRVRSLRGALAGKRVREGDYRRYLEEKHR